MNPESGPVLQDIHLPPPPAWWPPAPGWWLLAGIGIVCLFFAFVRWRKVQREKRFRREVLAEFDGCIEDARGDPARLAAALSQFLRRMTLRRDAAAAAYPGDRWLAHLDAQANTEEFSNGVGRVLIQAPFRAAMHYDAAALIALVRRWVRCALATEARHA